MPTENILLPYEKIKKIEQEIILKVKNFMVYQYNEKEDFKEGYWGELEYEESKEINAWILKKILSELVFTSKIEDEEENISHIFQLIRSYLDATNFVREQKYLGVKIKDLKFFEFRKVYPFSQAYGMFYFVPFIEEFCEEYLNSNLQSSFFEKIIVYDLACCEFSSFIDEQTIPLFIRINLRKKKYSPILLSYYNLFYKGIKELINLVLSYYILIWIFIENKDIAMLAVLFGVALKFKTKYEFLDKKIEGLTMVSTRLQDAKFRVSARHALRLANIATERGGCYPIAMFNILDRAIEEKYW